MKSNLVTVVTLIDDCAGENYTTVVQGRISETQRKAMAKAFKANDNSEPEEERLLFFCEVKPCNSWKDAKDLRNIDSPNLK